MEGGIELRNAGPWAAQNQYIQSMGRYIQNAKPPATPKHQKMMEWTKDLGK
jgi:hypothetical protein